MGKVSVKVKEISGTTDGVVLRPPPQMNDRHGMGSDGSVHPRTIYVRRSVAAHDLGEIQGVADKPVGTMNWLDVASANDAIEIAEYSLVGVLKFKLTMEETNG